MSGSTKRERKDGESSLPDPEKEAEALLRAAQDDLLLKLRIDSHPISSRPSSAFSASSASLNPDLVRRFEALKSPPPLSGAPPSPPSKLAEKGAVAKAETEGGDDEWGRILGDDLAARLSALKGSSSGHNQGFRRPDLMPEKEVEKVMQWAMDAARLDSSKRDKDDDDDDDDDDEKEEEEEEDLNEKRRREN